MKGMTLVTRRLYFGLDAHSLRDGSGRLLARIGDIPHDRAVVRMDAIVEDFRVSAAASRGMVDQMVQDGLLQRLRPGAYEFTLTDKLRRIARASIIDPLPRTRAKMLLDHIADVSWHFNRTATNNKYEIEAVAVYGTYMSRDPVLTEITLGVTGRRRLLPSKPPRGQAAQPLEGHERIRQLFEEQSEFVSVRFFQKIEDMPRPFSVVYKSDG